MNRCLFVIALALFTTTIRAADPPRVANLTWLAGTWKSPAGEKTPSEETWVAPTGGSMMGMFRMMPGGKPSLYEFLLIEDDADGVVMRFRHYRPGMVDVDKEPLILRSTETSDKRIVLEAQGNGPLKKIVYERESANRVVVTVDTTRESKPLRLTIPLERTPPK